MLGGSGYSQYGSGAIGGKLVKCNAIKDNFIDGEAYSSFNLLHDRHDETINRSRFNVHLKPFLLSDATTGPNLNLVAQQQRQMGSSQMVNYIKNLFCDWRLVVLLLT
jgi:hypothetical protein